MLSQIDFSEVSLEDFEFYEKLGSGSYGQVYRTKFKLNDEIYALKKLDKDFITKVFFSSSLKIESKNEKPSKGARYSDEYWSSEHHETLFSFKGNSYRNW